MIIVSKVNETALFDDITRVFHLYLEHVKMSPSLHLYIEKQMMRDQCILSADFL